MESEEDMISSTVSDNLDVTLQLEEQNRDVLEVQPVIQLLQPTSAENAIPIISLSGIQTYDQTVMQSLISGTSCEMPVIYREVPDVVAAETVVTTTMTEPRQPKQTYQAKNPEPSPSEEACMMKARESELSLADSSTGNYEEITSWDVLLNTDTDPAVFVKTASDLDMGEPGDGHYVALVPDSTSSQPDILDTSSSVSPQESSIREINKRQRDKAKKRQLRCNREFREKEKQLARIRMALKRADPSYREKEREKDRIRRRQSRLRNEIQRQKERARDRHYKRLHRSIPMQLPTTSISDHLILNEVEISQEGFVHLREGGTTLQVVETFKDTSQAHG